ncbi:hypothetical protein PROFUN_07630 [Planoprotostelium fungivorum]|uniref:Uncharacterized protein n=1 Tax=Planoprotostelium fungivorum TaxID=1890364 RepID=A0A2P6NK82_9EUKA|nr:hypothetical protein PROFUN_07630 [Planoprotostelium fungivorum]
MTPALFVETDILRSYNAGDTITPTPPKNPDFECKMVLLYSMLNRACTIGPPNINTLGELFLLYSWNRTSNGALRVDHFSPDNWNMHVKKLVIQMHGHQPEKPNRMLNGYLYNGSS